MERSEPSDRKRSDARCDLCVTQYLIIYSCQKEGKTPDTKVAVLRYNGPVAS